MGTDIHGYIEFRLKHGLEYWHAAINIGSMAERYYNQGFTPAASRRM
jgi:hypothetical protein